MSAITCYTAPGVQFTDREALLAHYKSDWHRYNLKRKVAGLPPVSKDQFEARKAAALAAKADQGKDKKQDHVKEEKKKNVSEKHEKRRHEMEQQQENGTEQAAETEEQEDEEIEVNLGQSLFDNHVEEDLPAILEYMKTFGFYIPDIEYLTDLEGLLTYLHEKTRVGKMCLYCQRSFSSHQACRQHMIDKNHCRLRYEEEDDIEEFQDFYDFSSSYKQIILDNRGAEEDMEDVPEGDEDESAEDILRGAPKIDVLPSGELLITKNGQTKRLGVRWLKRYYKQNAPLIDQRESVLAAQKEHLRLMYQRAGMPTTSEIINQAAASGNRSLAKIANKHQPRYVGAELVAARRHFRAFHNQRMKMGLQQNWLTKNVTAGKNRGEGVGVHG